MPIELLPPYKKFGSMERIDTLEREVESLIARLTEEHQGHLTHKIDSNGNGNGNGNGYDNGNGSHSDRGSGSRRTVHTTQGCTYKEFLNCQPLTLRALKELWDYPDGLKKWNQRTVHTTQGCTYKEFLNCQPLTLRALKELWDYPDGLKKWNQTVGIDVAYEMSSKDLMKMMTKVYYPRNEIQMLEGEFWNLTMKGTDVAGYT
nr:hypothetical protein [Tanacetum cinerariifolium]